MQQAVGICILLIIAGSFSDAAAASGKKNDSFDSLMLTREWPFSFCSVESCHNTDLLQPKFNIHGLWPDVANASSSEEPMFCNATFNVSDLDPLLPELNQNWMDLTKPNGSAVAFWRQEFKKHGSCIVVDSQYNTTFLYFKTALQLHKKYSLDEMLVKGGVKPGSSPINASKIRAVLRDSFGFDAGVRCFKNEKGGTVYLYELRLCFTKDLQPMNCEVKLPQAAAAAAEAVEDEARRQRLLQLLPSPLQDLLRTGERLLRRLLRLPGVPRGAGAGETGSYECHEGEMVQLPDSTTGL